MNINWNYLAGGLLLREACGALNLKWNSYQNKQKYYLLGGFTLPGGGWFRLVRSSKGPDGGGRGGGGGGGFCPGAPKYFVIESSSFWICAAVTINTFRYL